MFCNKCDIPFDSDIVKVTAYTGVAAAQFKIPGATTIHGAANLNSKSPKRQSSDWVNTIITFIDEISFMLTPTLEKLDRRLRIQTGKMDKTAWINNYCSVVCLPAIHLIHSCGVTVSYV